MKNHAIANSILLYSVLLLWHKLRLRQVHQVRRSNRIPNVIWSAMCVTAPLWQLAGSSQHLRVGTKALEILTKSEQRPQIGTEQNWSTPTQVRNLHILPPSKPFSPNTNWNIPERIRESQKERMDVVLWAPCCWHQGMTCLLRYGHLLRDSQKKKKKKFPSFKSQDNQTTLYSFKEKPNSANCKI